MAWVRYDQGFPRHPKVRRAARVLGSNGLGRVLAVHLEATCYCNEHLTDGHIDHSIAKLFESDRHPIQVLRVFARDSIRLAIKVKGGFQLHDYDDYQPSKAEVEKARQKERNRKRVYRLRPEVVPVGPTVVSGGPIRTVTTDPSGPDRTEDEDHEDQDPPLRGALSFPQAVENSKPNISQLRALAQDLIGARTEDLPPSEDREVRDALKDRAAKAGLPYDAESVRKAVDSAIGMNRRMASTRQLA